MYMTYSEKTPDFTIFTLSVELLIDAIVSFSSVSKNEEPFYSGLIIGGYA